MELKEIAAISGKEGLFKVLKPARNGIIVETLDAQKKKIAIGSAGKVSILKEISIYTTTKEGTIALQEVLILMHEKYQGQIPIDSKANTADLMNFIAELLPEFDAEKVYPSDVKKLIKWYNILIEQAPEVFVKQEEKTEKDEKVEEKTENQPLEETTETHPPQTEETKTEEVQEISTEKPKKTRTKASKKEEKQADTNAEQTPEEKPKKTRTKKQS